MGGLVVTADKAQSAVDQLDVPNVSPGYVSQVLRNELRATARAPGRNVNRGEEQGAKLGELLQQFVARRWVEADLPVAGVEEVLTSEVLVVDEDVQHHVFNPGESVPGNVPEEEVGVRVVGLVAGKLGELELKPGVCVGETAGDLTLQVGDLLQQGPVHVADVVQPDDGVVQDGGASDHGDVWVALLILDQLFEEVPIVVEDGEGVVRVEGKVLLAVLIDAG